MSTAFEQYVKVTLGDHNHKDKVKPSPIQHYHVTKVSSYYPIYVTLYLYNVVF